jgi:nucleoside-diphosphate-sugar epimerase
MEYFMNKAIITGASGLIGMSVAKYLSSFDIQLLCLGRQNLSEEECNKYFGRKSKYINLPMNNIALLPDKLKTRGWGSFEDAVFYNFAWSGNNSLADGSLSDQLQNAICSADAVKVAKALGCSKFINSGSMEETFLDTFLKSRVKQPFRSAQTNYGIAKLASRDMSKMVAYNERIDYIHTRISVPLDASLTKGTYINSIIKKIINKEEYETPQSMSLFDLVLLEDVAHAYYLIGQKGLNKADYYIGRGTPATLIQHFQRINQLICGGGDNQNDSVKNSQVQLFDTEPLRRDTGFVPSLDFKI